METYFIRHTKISVPDSALEQLRRKRLIAIHYPQFRGRLREHDNVSLDPKDYRDGGVAATRALTRLANNGGYVFAEYRDSPQPVVGIVKKQAPVIFKTRWEGKRRTAMLKAIRVAEWRAFDASKLPRLPAKPARRTICTWHRAGAFVSRLLKRSSARGAPSSRQLTDRAVNQTGIELERVGNFDPRSVEGAREYVLASIARRRGQPKFRAQLMRAYEGRCAISGCETAVVLEAAHIISYRGPKTNHVQNGLLLRSDLHLLFDLGLLSIDKDLRVSLDPSLRRSSYAEFHGQKLRVPTVRRWQPNRRALAKKHRR